MAYVLVFLGTDRTFFPPPSFAGIPEIPHERFRQGFGGVSGINMKRKSPINATKHSGHGAE
jgi:hypothetical protein